MKTRTMVSLFLLTFLLACGEDTDQDIHAVDNHVDARLVGYFESFRADAEKWDIEVDYAAMNVKGYIENISDRGVAGQCQTYVNGNKAVVFDEAYWNKSANLKKEFLVYHELGHCILGRDHLDDSNRKGDCKSIMNSGGTSCILNYTAVTREAFLEELFTNF